MADRDCPRDDNDYGRPRDGRKRSHSPDEDSRKPSHDNYRNRDYKDDRQQNSTGKRPYVSPTPPARRNRQSSPTLHYNDTKNAIDEANVRSGNDHPFINSASNGYIPPPPTDSSVVPDSQPAPPPPPPKKRVPLSVEELMKKKETESNKQEKPVFLSKEERAKLALERRQAEANAIREQQEAARADRPDRAVTNTVDSRNNSNHNKDRRMDYRHDKNSRYDDRRGLYDRGRGDSREDYGRDRNGRYDDRDRDRDRMHDKSRDRKEKSSSDGLPFNEKELLAIRDKYMGTADRAKRRIRKMNEKKFVFDWHEEEDTSRDINPIYMKKHDAQLFGRGHIAGIDIKEQKKLRSSFYNSLLEARRNIEETERAKEMEDLEAKRARQVAFDDRHWSEKPLAEMKERDWRIFREDFNISTKGGILPNPVRSWDESGIPERILKVIQSVGYTEPTPIQRVSIPIGLQNRDLI
ncbi:hypothetical protein SeMB42_g07770, partial [Synchytrium endobioticum]